MHLASLILILFLVIPFSYALTASIGNARMVLRPIVKEGETTVIDKSILVSNTNNISVLVKVEPDNMFKKIIDVEDDEFILQPDQSRNAKFTITLKSGGRYDGRILVSFDSADSNIEASTVGLSSRIIILADGPITDEYYEVIKEEENKEPQEEIVEEVEDDVLIEDYEDIEGNVSVSTGGSRPESKERKEVKDVSISPLIGILIVAFIIIIGLAVFFIINRIVKK